MWKKRRALKDVETLALGYSDHNKVGLQQTMAMTHSYDTTIHVASNLEHTTDDFFAWVQRFN